jgi:hypothetical protein
MARTDQSASDWVRESIERDGVVRQGLARGLINVRALAREIHTAARGRVSFDALLGAIHRYPLEEGVERRRSAGRAIRKISLRNRVAILSFRNVPDLRPAIARFVGETSRAREEMLRVSTSPEAVSVTFDEARMKDLEARVPKSDVLRRWTDLAEIKVEASLEVEAAPGILAVLTSELAVNDVNVVQLSTVGPGYIVLLVKEEDATRAYGALSRLAKTGESGGP